MDATALFACQRLVMQAEDVLREQSEGLHVPQSTAGGFDGRQLGAITGEKALLTGRCASRRCIVEYLFTVRLLYGEITNDIPG